MTMHSKPGGCDRRDFLKTSAALAGGMAAGRFAMPASMFADDSDEAAPQIPFGFSLYGMRSLDVIDALETCREIGYDAVELVAVDGWPCDPGSLSQSRRRDIRRQLEQSQLRLSAIMENLHVVVDDSRHRANLDRLKAAGELGHEFSPERPPVLETILGGRPNQWDELKNKMAARLADWAKAGEQSQTVIAIKPHVGGALHRPGDAKWLADQVDSPWVKLAYDYSHFQLRDFPLDGSLNAMIDDTVFVHVKDTRGQVGDFRFLLPGEGNIDYSQYLQLLRSGGYRGAVIVEVSGQIHGKPDYDPVAAARTSYENLAPAFEAAGLRG